MSLFLEVLIRPIWPVDNLISIKVKNGEAELWVYSLAEKDIQRPWYLQRHILAIKDKDDTVLKSGN